jgi:hypothetical protein
MSRVFDTGRAGETPYDVEPRKSRVLSGTCERSLVDAVCGGDW